MTLRRLERLISEARISSNTQDQDSITDSLLVLYANRVQSMIEETNLNIVEGKTPKDDKTTRVYAQTPRLESKRVKIVKGHWNEKFINQCLAFPNSLHDDMVDVLTASMAQLFDDTFDFGFIG